MLTLARAIEMPRHTREQIQKRFPGYVVMGDKQGWFYPVHDTKTVVVSMGWNTLVKDVRKHMQGNGVTVPSDLATYMGKWWCREVSSEHCVEMDPAKANALSLTRHAERFFNVVKAFISGGCQRVPQEEAERRAAICASCPRMVDEQPFCPSCFSAGIINWIAGHTVALDWRTSHDEKLKSCGVCNCRLKLKAHLPQETLNDPSLDDYWPAEYPCWMKEAAKPVDSPASNE